MKKIHLKFSLLLVGIVILSMISAKVKQETKQAVHENAKAYLNEQDKSENKEYRYYLSVFQIFNAQ